MSIRPFFYSLLLTPFLVGGGVMAPLAGAQSSPVGLGESLTCEIANGATLTWEFQEVRPGTLVEWAMDIPAWNLEEEDRVAVRLTAGGQSDVTKELHAGDRTLLVPVHLKEGGRFIVTATSHSPRNLPLSLKVREWSIPQEDRAAFEAEPNNSWKEANPLVIGRTVYGNNEDADYLDNKDERPLKGYAGGLDNPRRSRPGLDWFRFEADWEEARLVFFELDVLDRDVSVNLRTYVQDATGTGVVLFTEGKDPMEIVHDREPERYSKSITRLLEKGTYYLQVNGNHPRYILRSKVYRLPPYSDPQEAVRTGAHYIMNVGDAWVAQVPREGNIYNRIQNMHDSTTRCTACHPSIFSTEAVLTAVKAGYPVEAKSHFRYVIDRIYNGPAPFYGPHEVNWQRYIAIPMQSQGKHGMVLKDFEEFVSQRETPYFERYAPFLRHAWTGMEELHPDEQNGVVPADSNVGFAVRDYIVLSEAARRTGERGYQEIADHVRDLVIDPECNKKTLQDEIHRVWGLAVMAGEQDELRQEREEAIAQLLTYQNEDGGWPDEVSYATDEEKVHRDSAVYTTGQVVWTLYQAGKNLGNCRQIKKAVDYLLSQQKEFGGWFQTTTHENFRTPMRETRYAVMGLASAFPLANDPVRGWGNRGGQEARLPRTDSLVHTLDDLDSLWEVPEEQEEMFTQGLVYLLDHEEPLVRSLAAEALGRVGTPLAIPALVNLLADPGRDVWRSAAWALRQFGNRGEGVEDIKAALSHENPAVRRAACRVFAYHYFGMEHRLDIAEDLMNLTRDENFWTRLEALKTLRQWFYRSGENSFKRKVVDLYIERMGQPEHSAIRSNLAQGMYIMLDENESGGVDIERNIARFPYERDRKAVIEARSHVEQAVLLAPILEALVSGNDLQRQALLASFDGSFFAGRFYARNPRNMIDVGNDREFSFYQDPPSSVLDRVFERVLGADLSPEKLAQAVKLAAFFHVPKNSGSRFIQSRFLDLLDHDDPEVSEQALKFLREEMALVGAESNEDFVARVAGLLENSTDEIREAVLSAVGRNHELLHREPIASLLRSWAGDEGTLSRLLPVVHTDILGEEVALELIRDRWSAFSQEEEARLKLVDQVFERKSLVEAETPHRDLIRILKRISLDEVTGIRESLFKHLEESPKLSASLGMGEVLHSGLTDRSAGIRLRALQLAQNQSEKFWKQGDTQEYLLKLIVDPDPKVRELALESTEKFELVGEEPRFAKRIKSLIKEDAELEKRAREILVAKGIDPASIEAEGGIQSFGVPDLDLFHETVNAIFYEPGADGHSCMECHQNHTILRISEWMGDPSEMPEDLVIQNFNSALKVVNLSDPEQSLILRKPRSPEGQGGETTESPTGLTHVGGPRWPQTTHPGYRALLEWIQDAASSSERRVGKLATVDSYSPDFPAEQVLDNDPRTLWHTEFVGASPGYPHEVVIDLGEPTETSALQYVPRQDGTNGRIKEWEIAVSEDGENWSDPAASGTWENDAAVKTVPLKVGKVRYVRLKGLSSVDGQPFMSAAEIIVLRARETHAPPAPGS
jgi:hypothetical protein